MGISGRCPSVDQRDEEWKTMKYLTQFTRMLELRTGRMDEWTDERREGGTFENYFEFKDISLAKGKKGKGKVR